MKERIRNNVYMTVCGLLLYLGSVWLSRSYHLPSDIAFGCFFAAYLLAGYSVFQKIAEHFLEKIFLDGNVLLVITTICACAWLKCRHSAKSIPINRSRFIPI